jgi:GT2 family glycosyltransferase
MAEAADVYGKYLALKPEDFAVWVQRGNCLKDSGALSAAGHAYAHAVRLRPEDADVHLQMGHLMKLQGRLEEALKSYMRSRDLDPVPGLAALELKTWGLEVDVRAIRSLTESPDSRTETSEVGSPQGDADVTPGDRTHGCHERLDAWHLQNDPSETAIQEQRGRCWPALAPRISLLIPVQTAGEVREVMHWMSQQTYPNSEIVFLAEPNKAREFIRGSAEGDRARFEQVEEGMPAEQGLETGRQRASGDFIAVVSASDSLSPNALTELADYILGNPATDVVYCDEDCVSGLGRRHSLRLKPGWSPEMLLGFHYIGRLCLIRREVLQEAGGFAGRFGDAQEYEAMLRVSERTTRIARLARCLYHRHAEIEERRPFAAFGGQALHREQALREHLARRGLDATVKTLPDATHRVAWPIAEAPLVSIIIPTRDQPEILKQCVEDLLHKTAYPRMEIILVDNDSTDESVKDCFQEWTRAGALQVVPFGKEFNYSGACNHGARFATGKLLLFLNNDISVMNADWLAELVRFALLPGIGCVGTKLLYPDGVVQHAGVVLGLHMCGLLYNGAPADRSDEYGSPNIYRNLLAVMGACQLVTREAFDAVGGFDERYRMANSDVALCLHLYRAGYRTVYTPHAALFHHEGHTRGRVNPPSDMALLAMDIGMLGIEEDPYFHPGLSPACASPTLRLRPEPTPQEALRNQIDMSMRKPPPFLDLNLWEDESVRRLLGQAADSLGVPNWSIERPPTDEWEAARFALWIIRSSPVLRARFPLALSDGVEGGFCRLLCDEVRIQHNWPEPVVEHLRRAFGNNPGERVRQIYEQRVDLQVAIAGASLAVGRPHFLKWLVIRGMMEYGLRGEQIWWFMLQSTEDPVRELAYQYSITPSWKSYFPDVLTEIGWPGFYRWAQSAGFAPPGKPSAPPALRSEIELP